MDPSSLPIHWVSIFFFGTVHAVALLAPWFFSWSALGVMLVLHWLCASIGICLGYHRLLTHRSFRVPKPVEYFFATMGALAVQGGPTFWVAGHRQHHMYTEDVDKDPYSARRGFWWSHILWLFYDRPSVFDRKELVKYVPDLARDRYYQWLDRYFLLLQVPLGVALYALGGWSFVIYGIAVRLVLVWHATWLINSATHKWGYRRFDVSDNSRNLWWAALLTYGEGWHNNHHAYPNVAKAGLTWWEVDPTWWVIRGLQMMGIAKRVIMPPDLPAKKA
ncbi:fatty acid desaturase [Leptolyngbya sp. CCY15150]|uniref:acyl-CoA desaturase n=1 Tax=Leptolyngbya sp. CCY15150 TaxID=2767772 RepID=UPI00194F46DB|nr:fatty acid desaturase [Leptolyngbya sp. CCY15150]